MRKKPQIGVDLGRIPPQAIDLEEAVLGALMLEPYIITQIIPILKSEVFYKEAHQKICDTIITLYNDEVGVDILTVTNKLSDIGLLEEIGGAYYISQLTNRVSTASHTHYHYRILMQKFFRRELIRIGQELSYRSYDESVDVFAVYEWIQIQLETLDMHASIGAYQDISKTIDKVLDIVHNSDKKKSFYPIADKGIDDILQISPSNILGISGKSGSGKTSYAVYLAKSLVTYYKDKVAFCWYTMEDEADKILMGMISPEVKLTHSQMHGKNYTLSKTEKELIKEKLNEYKKFDIEFIEKSSSMAQIKPHFQQFCANRPNKFNILIIDNIMTLADNQSQRFKGNQNTVDDYIAGEMYRTFESTKGAFDVNIWYLHHLTKEQLSAANAKDGYRPREDHIRGSARLRDASTQGILIHRPGEHIDIVKHYRKTEYEEPIKNLMINEVFKNRNGNTGFMRYFNTLDYKIFYPF